MATLFEATGINCPRIVYDGRRTCKWYVMQDGYESDGPFNHEDALRWQQEIIRACPSYRLPPPDEFGNYGRTPKERDMARAYLNLSRDAPLPRAPGLSRDGFEKVRRWINDGVGLTNDSTQPLSETKP